MKIFLVLLTTILTGCATTSSLEKLDSKIRDKDEAIFNNLHSLNVDNCAIYGYICLQIKKDQLICEQQYAECRRVMDDLYFKDTGHEYQYSK